MSGDPGHVDPVGSRASSINGPARAPRRSGEVAPNATVPPMVPPMNVSERVALLQPTYRLDRRGAAGLEERRRLLPCHRQ